MPERADRIVKLRIRPRLSQKRSPIFSRGESLERFPGGLDLRHKGCPPSFALKT
jgi:hypothetical protein